MAYYIFFSLICAVLGLIYLNRGHGSKRLYASIGAVGTFLLFMWRIGAMEDFAFSALISTCAASIICGAVMYWLVLLVQWLWGRGAAGKAIALVACVATFYISGPILLIGKTVRRLFGKQFDALDAAAEEERCRREEARKEAQNKITAAEEEILQQVHTDEELCTFFADIYRSMGYEPVLARQTEDGPLCMFLEKDGQTFSFVALCRREVLGPESVEWAAAFRGSAQRAGLVTTGTFTGRAVKTARRLKVDLVDRPNLPRFVRAARRSERRRAFGTTR